jgi:uridylate kinase
MNAQLNVQSRESQESKSPKYRRIVLKISGEALAGPQGFGIDFAIAHYIAEEIAAIVKLGIEVGVVLGGGNLFRGATLYNNDGLGRITGDHMGMIATLINALALRDVFIQSKIQCEVMSALPIRGIVAGFDRNLALRYLEEKRVIIFSGGTGNPLVTTDFALSLRGIELDADLLLKATNVDGVYNEDPRKNARAKQYHRLTYKEAIDKELAVMDLVAFCQCRDHNMKLRVFNLRKHGALLNIILGKDEGTLVENV